MLVISIAKVFNLNYAPEGFSHLSLTIINSLTRNTLFSGNKLASDDIILVYR